MRRNCAVAVAAAATLAAAPATAQIAASVEAPSVAPDCAQGCTLTLTPAQLLAQIERLVLARKFDEASPLLAALGDAPGMAMKAHFLKGYVAVETRDLPTAIAEFRAALAIDPKQTRVRLELARAMALQGNDSGAAYHYRLAAQDAALPPEIRATVQAQRGVLRDRRPWRVSFDVGIAPDTNINNGTSAETIDLVIGNQTVPLTLDANARKRSGIGQTAGFSAGYRFKVAKQLALLVDGDFQGVNYAGTAADDFTLQLAAGPEFRPSERTSISLQGLALQRWYGGSRAVTQFGSRLTMQRTLDEAQRIGVTLDVRHAASGFQTEYSGWNLALYATYERVVARSIIATASVFARRDLLNGAAFSSKELGLSLGIGGELKYGINAGITTTGSRAVFDAPLAALSPNARADWRLSTRVYAGLRSVRVLGFSPSVSFTQTLNDSSIGLYASDRSRFAFNLARYF